MKDYRKFVIRWIARFVMGAAVIFGVLLIMIAAWAIFWDRPNLVTTCVVALLSCVIGYSIEKFYLDEINDDNKKIL